MEFTPEVLGMRWGYGLPLPDEAPRDRAGLIARLRGPDLAAPQPLVRVADIVPDLNELRLKKKNSKKDPVLREEVALVERRLAVQMEQGIAATFQRAIDSPDGFRERLVQFWADHFTTANRSSFFALMPLAQAEEAIRPHVAGRFADLLKAAVLHPAMIDYLDQTRSVGPNSELGGRRGLGLNENLARELLELHTLGVGSGYRQGDVYQTAELLTGYGFDVKAGGLYFDPSRAEPGPEWVLGQRYEGSGTAPILELLEDLAQRPETARNIARKLLTHFVTDQPEAADVAALQAAFVDSAGDLPIVYDRLLSLACAADPRPGKVRQPFDFMVAGFRALGVAGAELMAMDRKGFRRGHMDAMALMGQRFKAPRGPDGAPEEPEAWITAQGLAMRVNWALALASTRALAGVDPVALARQALGRRADEALLLAVSRAEQRSEAVAVLMGSPAFNRR